MGLNYEGLDDDVRILMLDEIEMDIAADRLYKSDNLSPQGKADYAGILKSVCAVSTDIELANEIKPRLNSHEKPRKLQNGTFSKPPIMRSNAHEMLAEGEFNRFYIRAICRHALNKGLTKLEVYRGKHVSNPRQESEAMIGKFLDAQQLLDDLRANPGVDTALGLPPGPNSGLSVRIP
ncbi:MAG: hypothetical protein JSS95_09485 [Acidobacteria bacterium]|nr:hypothetical protein [Acidobacteriota bacterium]